MEKAIALALATLALGLALRAVPSVGMLLLGTVVSMSGLAVRNVAMPSLIREHYAERTAAMTGVYTTTMSLDSPSLGRGFGVFALVLVVSSRSGSTTADATAMSTLAQSVGYRLGTMGPFGMGLAHSVSGGWSVPLLLLVGVSAVQLVLAWLLTATYRTRTNTVTERSTA